MKTDRELLELAAKAVGLSGYINEWINGPEFIIPGENPVVWNPVRDDGDALRLVVKLKLEVGVWFETTRVESDEAESMVEKHGSDPYAATRRAIVRAAAEIQLQREKA